MRTYEQAYPRWKEIFHLLHWHLRLRLRDARRATEYAYPPSMGLHLEQLRESYLTSRFLHRYFGYVRLTKLEQNAKDFLDLHGSEILDGQ